MSDTNVTQNGEPLESRISGQARQTAIDIWKGINTALEKTNPGKGVHFKESFCDTTAEALELALTHFAAPFLREIEGLKKERDHLNEVAYGNHNANPEKCPTYYDGCNCGGSTAERLEQVEAERDQLKVELQREKGRLDTLESMSLEEQEKFQWNSTKLGFREAIDAATEQRQEIRKPIKAQPNQVVRMSTSRIYVTAREHDLPDGAEIIANRPHEDGDYSYPCGSDHCRCMS